MGWDHADWANPILYKSPTGLEEQKVLLPKKTELVGNYPNPFNPTTTIVFNLNKNAKVEIEIFNILGQKSFNCG